MHLALNIAETQIPSYRACILGLMAQLYLLDDNLSQAEAALDQGKQDPNRQAWPVYFVPVRLAEAELGLKQGEVERGLTVTDALLVDLRQFGLRSQLPSALYLQGQALLASGQSEAARERWLEARAVAETLGSRHML